MHDPILQVKSLQNIVVQLQDGQRQKDNLPTLDFEERLLALNQEFKTDLINSIKVALAESRGAVPLQLPLTETLSRDTFDRSVKQAYETQEEIGGVKRQLSR